MVEARKAETEKGSRDEEEMAKFYFGINEETIDSLADKYKAEYFISETDYSYPIVYSKGKVKVYRLPAR